MLDPDGAATPIGVSLDSPGSAGRVVFAAERNAQAANQLSLELPVDGTPVDFWGLGRFQSPSRADGDARITVRPATGNVALLTVPLMVRVRKDAQTLTFAERNRFLSALARLSERGTYQNYRDMHLDNTSDEAHGLDGFLPWHRAYLLDLERELQAIDPSVALPYWRFDQPAGRLQRSIVNQHGLELYLVDPGLRIEKTWARIPWEVGEVAKTLVSDRR